ncbi:DNA polymerase III subunit delta [Mariniphaga sediminis]|jgi:DNA polymerase-3 subunit delta|uniref:DNA polymerase III subunit delta n=1 Tax=Mariniphaga sediminis TaxID=1628158 RepID=A0A399D0R2_9BACT|nr:DNA polymerase III subunit delta [Mariniphaga sediminis]RIH65167.1 DNA polymerase III subunit delta [Mariniphaga sediminis]
MEFDIILQNLKKQVYHPIYLLQGEEPYFIDQVSNYIEKNVLTEAEKGFNLTIFYGKDSEPQTIAEASLRYPMMADRQVIIVKEAQSLKRIEDLVFYAEKPMPSTILVLNYKYKNLDARTKLYKAIKSKGVILSTKQIYESQVPAWIENYLKQYNYTIIPQASQILTASLGTELSKISNELNKLVIAVKDTNRITPEHIEKNIGLSKDFNLLELQDALGSKNVLKANQIINYFGSNPQQHPIQKTTATLFSFYSKIFSYHFLKDKSERGAIQKMGGHPFYIKKIMAAAKKYSPTKLYEIMGILREYDLKSKGLGVSTLVDTAELQKEMIYKILH